MKLPKEIRAQINQCRRSRGKPNGVIRWLLDAINMEVKLSKNKRITRRPKFTGAEE